MTRPRTSLARGIAITAALAALLLLPGSSRAADDYPHKNAICVSTGQLTGKCPGYDWGYKDANGKLQTLNPTTLFSYRNCTDFVALRLGLKWSQFKFASGKGNAIDWKDYANNAGFTITSQPSAGDIAWWGNDRGYGKYGHVAIVTKVNADGSAAIEGYNGVGTGVYESKASVQADTYLHRRTSSGTTVAPTQCTSQDYMVRGFRYIATCGGTANVNDGGRTYKLANGVCQWVIPGSFSIAFSPRNGVYDKNSVFLTIHVGYPYSPFSGGYSPPASAVPSLHDSTYRYGVGGASVTFVAPNIDPTGSVPASMVVTLTHRMHAGTFRHTPYKKLTPTTTVPSPKVKVVGSFKC